jgi:hypothetical protein
MAVTKYGHVSVPDQQWRSTAVRKYIPNHVKCNTYCRYSISGVGDLLPPVAIETVRYVTEACT